MIIYFRISKKFGLLVLLVNNMKFIWYKIIYLLSFLIIGLLLSWLYYSLDFLNDIVLECIVF